MSSSANASASAASTSSQTLNPNKQELEETVSRLSSHAGVQSVLVLTRTGEVLAAGNNTASNAASDTDVNVAAAVAALKTTKLVNMAQDYLNNNKEQQEDPVSFIQIRSQSGKEIMIAPHDGYVLAVQKR